MGIARTALLATVLACTPARSAAPTDISAWVDASLSPVDSASRGPDLTELSAVYPVRWRVARNGGLQKIPSHGLDRLKDAPRPTQLRYLPTIQNLGPSGFDPGLLRAVLAHPASRELLIADLVALNQQSDVDGLNVDFEAMSDPDGPVFTAFLKDLKARMGGRGSLTVCVPARTSDRPAWHGARFVQWREVGQIADEVMIMAYDHSWANSKPGAVSPAAWVERVLSYATTQVPIKKIRLGLPLYGYRWSDDGGTAIAIRNMNALGPEWKPARTQLSDGVHLSNGTAQLYIDNATTLRHKIALAGRMGVHHIALWHLGQAEVGFVAALKKE
ncbi:MAG: spore germination protein [Kiritimatiellia bacterium]